VNHRLQPVPKRDFGRGNIFKSFAVAAVLIVSLVCSLVLVSCCPTSRLPLSDPKTATYDKRLEGSWRFVSDEGSIAFFHFGKMEGNLTKVISIGNKDNGDLEYTVYAMFPTFIGNSQYMNIIFDDISKGVPKEIEGYEFARYEFEKNNNSLVFSLMSANMRTDAVKSGKLKGTIKYNKPSPVDGNKELANNETADSTYCATITDTPDNMIRFIKDSDPKILFPNPVKLEKVR